MTKSDNDKADPKAKKKTPKAGAKGLSKAKRTSKKATKYERPRGGAAKSISDLMPEIGRAAFRRFGFVQSSIVSRWPEIVGERYSDVSLPESIRFPQGKRDGGTLNLIVSGAHATLMQHVTVEIIDRVNQFFGYAAVAKVRIRQGQIDRSHERENIEKKRPAAPPSLKPIPLELGESLRDIGDPELHAVLESFARTLANSSGTPQIEPASPMDDMAKLLGGLTAKDKKD